MRAWHPRPMSGKSAFRRLLLDRFPSALVPASAALAAADVLYVDLTERLHCWRNQPGGTADTPCLTGRDFVEFMFTPAISMLQHSSASTLVLAVDDPAYVPTAKQATQRARDTRRDVVPMRYAEGDVIVSWAGCMPPSDAMLANRDAKRASVVQALQLLPCVTHVAPGKTIVMSGHDPRHNSVFTHAGVDASHAAASPAERVGEAELRWVSFCKRSADVRMAGNWVVVSKDTDSIVIAALHARELLLKREVYIHYGADKTVDLRRMAHDVDSAFAQAGSDWTFAQLAACMQLAGNDFQTGWHNVAQTTLWNTIWAHSKATGRVVLFGDGADAETTFSGEALQRLLTAVFYRRYKLERWLPPPHKCSWAAVASHLAQSKCRVPTPAEIKGCARRFRWNVLYWLDGDRGVTAVPGVKTSRGWKRDATGAVLPA